MTPQDLFQQALACYRARRLDAARALCAQVLDAQPRSFDALHLLGVIALETNDAARGADLLRAALRIDPSSASAHHGLGLAHMMRREFEAAVASYDRAIGLDPRRVDAFFNRGIALDELALHQAAIASFDQALSLAPAHADAWNNRGIAFYSLRQYAAAATSFERSLELRPNSAPTLQNLGNALQELGQYRRAIGAFDRSLALDPKNAAVHRNRARALIEVQRYRDAVLAYDAAIALSPELRGCFGERQFLKMRICDWRDFYADRQRLIWYIEREIPAVDPFCVLAVLDSPPAQQKTAATWMRAFSPAQAAATAAPAAAAAPAAVGGARERIRIGYFSADYHNHATLHLMAGLFEEHDRTRFAVTAFSFGPDSDDPMRRRVRAACERFIDVGGRSDEEVAALSRELGIDIAVDLKGHTRGSRPGLFVQRAAPLQVGFLGYPGTFGTRHLDYLVADAIVIPATNRGHYSEKILYVPGCYQVNDARRAPVSRSAVRADLGLPAGGFVFCCFNASYKITPAMFEIWLKILRRVPGSVLWLLEDNAAAPDHLRQAAARGGIGPERLVFAPKLAPAAHLERHPAADLFLDTFPCNAHTTASDALWAGVPLVTLVGASFASRVASSLLVAAGLPELAVADPAQYEDLAVALASTPERLQALRTRLAENLATGALFDTARYARHLEYAYLAIHERRQAGLPPAHFIAAAAS